MNSPQIQQDKHFFEFGPFRLDVGNRLLLRNNEVVPIKRKAVDTLMILVRRRGEVVGKEELMQSLWPDTFVEESNLTQYIYLLRKTLGEGDYITTISGRGYRFTSDAREVSEPHSETALEDHAVTRVASTEKAAELRSANEESPRNLIPTSFGRYKRAMFLSMGILVSVAVALGLWNKLGATKAPTSPSRLVFATSFAGNETEPAFSPDGKHIAFIWDGENGDTPDVYVKLLEVGEPLRLTTDPGWERMPVWSPDGRYIAFLRGTGGGQALILMPSLGGPERVLGEVTSGLDWAPDGRSLAVIDAQRTVTLLSLENGQRTRLTTPPSNILGDDHPVFGPDGQKIAFTRSDGGSENIFIVPTSGGELRQMTFENTRIQSLRWTPDGKHLIFASNRSGSFQFWRISESGSSPELVTSAGSGPTDFAISRDGSQMVFAQTSVDTNIWHLEVADVLASFSHTRSGSSNRSAGWSPLIVSSRTDDSPQYSPDGLRIAFASQRSGNEEIWICDSDGSTPRQLTRMRGPSTGSPRWSPDGRELAFDSRVAGQAEIFVISAEGGPPRRSTNDAALDVVPSWSRNGQWIYFSSMRSGERQIWKTPATGGEAIQVTRDGGFDSFESADGKYLYYTKKRETGGIWRLSFEGGDEVPIQGLESVKGHRAWAVTDRGIYFAHATTPRSLLKFYDFATGRVSAVSTLAKDPIYGPPGLSVSPDERSVLYVQRDSSSSDIMLLENFR